MNTIAECIDGFETLVTSHSKAVSCTIESAREAIDAVNKVGAKYDDADALKKARCSVIDRFVGARVSSRFAILSPAMFAMQRHLCVSWEFDKPRIIVDAMRKPADATDQNKPHFVRWLSGDLFMRHDVFSSSYSRPDKHTVAWCTTPGSRSSNRTILTCKFPGEIPKRCITLADECRSIAYRAIADLYADATLAPVMRHNYERKIEPVVAAYWIPSLDSIAIEQQPIVSRRDPALVLECFGQKFLCGLWTLEKENPLEAIVREFSDGAVNVVDDE